MTKTAVIDWEGCTVVCVVLIPVQAFRAPAFPHDSSTKDKLQVLKGVLQ